MSKGTNKQRRDKAIRAYYAELRDKKEDGVAVYSFDYCIKKVHEKFFLAPATIERIINEKDRSE